LNLTESRADMGDETLPYATRFVDEYTKTKLQGEKLLRAFSGRCGILTCAFRPGAHGLCRLFFLFCSLSTKISV
jgi:nucleoside-diphosphate-sugar epimerase